MEIEYLGPTRYDFGDSDSEDDVSPNNILETPPVFTLRLQPNVVLPTTLVINLQSTNVYCTSGLGTKIGVIYAPCTQPSRQMPIGNTVATNSALGHIMEINGVVYVFANSALPLELQHGWVKTVFERIRPERVVLVDEVLGEAEFRSPAVLASVVIVGLSAAVLNYADTYGVACRHVRGAKKLVGAKDIDELFKENQESAGKRYQQGSYTDTIKHEVSTSLYV
ncbi:hypothetical protein FB645_002441 [Coemansia sp. IMI 203386]|nr:hypothetical protein FB645_002441 [Coemansia sp. IMI 203386]